jgi:hypothetical protein
MTAESSAQDNREVPPRSALQGFMAHYSCNSNAKQEYTFVTTGLNFGAKRDLTSQPLQFHFQMQLRLCLQLLLQLNLRLQAIRHWCKPLPVAELRESLVPGRRQPTRPFPNPHIEAFCKFAASAPIAECPKSQPPGSFAGLAKLQPSLPLRTSNTRLS